MAFCIVPETLDGQAFDDDVEAPESSSVECRRTRLDP
jgi:hypothetical protein